MATYYSNFGEAAGAAVAANARRAAEHAAAARPTREELLAELAPLVNVISEIVDTTPVRFGYGGTRELVQQLALGVAAYVGRDVLPDQPPTAYDVLVNGGGTRD